MDGVNCPHGKAKPSDRARDALLGVCEYCNAHFGSGLLPFEAAKGDIQERLNVHECKREDAKQGRCADRQRIDRRDLDYSVISQPVGDARSR